MKYLLIAILFIVSCSDGNNVPDDKDDDGNEAGKDSTIIVPPTDTLWHNDTSAVITSSTENIYHDSVWIAKINEHINRKVGANVVTAVDAAAYLTDANCRDCGSTNNEWFNETSERIYQRKVGEQLHRSTVYHYADRRRFVNY